MRTRILLCILLLLPNLSFGQTRQLGWDQEAVSSVAASSFTYKYYLDGRTTGTVLIGVKCVGSVSPFQCSCSAPAFTPGTHSIVITSTVDALESEKGAPMQFTMAILSPPRTVKFK